MPGDAVVLDGAKLKGYKGLHAYSMSAGEGAPCMGDRERVRREKAQTQGAAACRNMILYLERRFLSALSTVRFLAFGRPSFLSV